MNVEKQNVQVSLANNNMTGLMCSVTSCAFNKENKCCNNSICVGGKLASQSSNTYCSSFQEAKFLVSLNENGKNSVYIECEAENCIHNKDGECNAENIIISSENINEYNDTMCGSFEVSIIK
ncbi:DUF1540 domain-containing protein [Clostridium gasigenes]|uniref:DUF1540 domain-containing protein n=1 Tax=Clostridium gasigenes TaxID=94869 RepID=UPI001626B9E0|nr:DUF1540 domain-containing protein [Clostridium gasigenes]MBB6623498.1 DUF1540 domain-containing protein [Clostridium gasigenes]MBU3104787.1 DUF1540 domain-containing protein [Clostridium gasigenes]MBU3108577.1 DUF1540 domain-containing protein [Clostridium gasigenes]MBU3133552.1 DUF1540 domain-containing protein [Clostridium gasigenes]MBU3137206.1 DUF1540 domain-containing protein [Clostridium gasigenes]